MMTTLAECRREGKLRLRCKRSTVGDLVQETTATSSGTTKIQARKRDCGHVRPDTCALVQQLSLKHLPFDP
jgi:hypothetical protein